MQHLSVSTRIIAALLRCIMLGASTLPTAALHADNAESAEDGEAAEDASVFTLEGEYVLDIVGVAQGERSGVRHVDLLTLTCLLYTSPSPRDRG